MININPNKKLIILLSENGIETFKDFVKNHYYNYKLYIEPEKGLHPIHHLDIVKEIIYNINVENKKVLLFTHSDYIIKELNAFIMFNTIKDNKKLLYKYGINDEYLLDFNIIEGFELFKKEIIRINITNRGIESKSINQLIDFMNGREDEIMMKLYGRTDIYGI